jgi:hypothetical protein
MLLMGSIHGIKKMFNEMCPKLIPSPGLAAGLPNPSIFGNCFHFHISGPKTSF